MTWGEGIYLIKKKRSKKKRERSEIHALTLISPKHKGKKRGKGSVLMRARTSPPGGEKRRKRGGGENEKVLWVS